MQDISKYKKRNQPLYHKNILNFIVFLSIFLIQISLLVTMLVLPVTQGQENIHFYMGFCTLARDNEVLGNPSLTCLLCFSSSAARPLCIPFCMRCSDLRVPATWMARIKFRHISNCIFCFMGKKTFSDILKKYHISTTQNIDVYMIQIIYIHIHIDGLVREIQSHTKPSICIYVYVYRLQLYTHFYFVWLNMIFL